MQDGETVHLEAEPGNAAPSGTIFGKPGWQERQNLQNEIEQAFGACDISLFLPEDPYAPITDLEGDDLPRLCRDYVILGELLKIWVLIKPKTSDKSMLETSTLFSKLTMEVHFQEEELDSASNKVSSSFGKGKRPSIVEHRPNHIFLPNSLTFPTGLPSTNHRAEYRHTDSVILPSGEVLYVLRTPVAVREEFLDKRIILVTTLRPVGILERNTISPSDSEFLYMLGQSFSAKEPAMRKVNLPVYLRLPLQLTFETQILNNTAYLRIRLRNTAGSGNQLHTSMATGALVVHDLRVNKDSTCLITNNPPPSANNPTEVSQTSPEPDEPSDPSSLLTAWVTRIYNPESSAPPVPTPTVSSSPIVPSEQHVPLEFDNYFTASVFAGVDHGESIRVNPGEQHVSVISIESKSAVVSSLGHSPALYESQLSIVWATRETEHCILSRFPFRWPKAPSYPLLLSVTYPSPSPLLQKFHVNLTVSNLSHVKRNLVLSTGRARNCSVQQPTPGDSLSMRGISHLPRSALVWGEGHHAEQQNQKAATDTHHASALSLSQVVQPRLSPRNNALGQSEFKGEQKYRPAVREPQKGDMDNSSPAARKSQSSFRVAPEAPARAVTPGQPSAPSLERENGMKRVTPTSSRLSGSVRIAGAPRRFNAPALPPQSSRASPVVPPRNSSPRPPGSPPPVPRSSQGRNPSGQTNNIQSTLNAPLPQIRQTALSSSKGKEKPIPTVAAPIATIPPAQITLTVPPQPTLSNPTAQPAQNSPSPTTWASTTPTKTGRIRIRKTHMRSRSMGTASVSATPNEGTRAGEIPDKTQESEESTLICLQRTLKIGDVEAFGTASVLLEFLALQEGLYEVSGVKVFDKISGHEYYIADPFYLWVVAE